MRLLRFIPIQLTIFLILGVLIGNWDNLPMYIPLGLTFACLGFLVFAFLKKRRPDSISFGLIVALTSFSIGVLAISLSNTTATADHYSQHNFQNRKEWRLKVTDVLKPSRFSSRYIVKVQALDQQIASGKILLNLVNDSLQPAFEVDNELLIFSKLTEIRPPLNPHQFNYKTYMAQMGIDHQLRVSKGAFLLKKGTSTLNGKAAYLRNLIKKKLQEAHFGPKELSIIQALLLGERNDLSEQTYNDYKNAGAVHILAVSGLHIGILLLLLQFLLSPLERLPKGKTLKLLVTVLLLWVFAFLAGMSASVVRAVSMFSFVAYALYLNRPSNTFNILALSMFFILLVDARLLFHIGFQMSYAAVFAIVWCYPLLQKLLIPKNFILKKIWQLLSVSIAAQLGVLPISLFYFHQFPGLFFVSNLLIVPFLGIVLGMGILVIVLVLFDSLPTFVANSYGFLISAMNRIISWIADQEAFIFQNISFDVPQVFLSYLIIIALITTAVKGSFKSVASLLFLLIVFQSWVLYRHYETQQKEAFIITHRTGNTLLLQQSGTTLLQLTSDSTQVGTIAKDYAITERTSENSYRSIPNSFTWGSKRVVLVDSTGVYPMALEQVDYLILTQSPKIHLARAVDSLKPKMIIADGSNYSNAIARWRATCKKQKLPFHYTGEKGAYFLDQDSD